MGGRDLSQEGKRTCLVSKGGPTASASTRFHFESADVIRHDNPKDLHTRLGKA